MIKRVTIRLDTETDAQVLAALGRIPPGERNARICAVLRREFGTQDWADLTQAVNLARTSPRSDSKNGHYTRLARRLRNGRALGSPSPRPCG